LLFYRQILTIQFLRYIPSLKVTMKMNIFPRMVISVPASKEENKPQPRQQLVQQERSDNVVENSLISRDESLLLELEDASTLLPACPTLREVSSRSSTTKTEDLACFSSPLSSSVSHRHVSFGSCTVRGYSQVLGDHPYCSMGCPLSLGWEYQQESAISVDDYEASHSETPSSQQQDLRLTWQERKEILEHTNTVDAKELRRACRRTSQNRHKLCPYAAMREERNFFACTPQRSGAPLPSSNQGQEYE
jgi:hypothetical protein